jgi:hypothetical protein
MAKRDRPLLQVRLTPEARAGLDRFTVRRGVTLTAYLEALGLLADGDPTAEAVFARARAIDQERRSRR